MTLNKITLKRYSVILLGSLLFCIGFNGFIVPVNLYSGGTMGIAQIISTLLLDYAHIDSLKNFNTISLDLKESARFLSEIFIVLTVEFQFVQ